MLFTNNSARIIDKNIYVNNFDSIISPCKLMIYIVSECIFQNVIM